MDAAQIQASLLVARALDELGIAYVIGGSMASSVHGIYRATADTDFVAAVLPRHTEALVRLLGPAFYADTLVIREAATAGRSFNVVHLETMLKVDVFVARDDPFRAAQIRRRILQATGPDAGASFYVTSPEDTVLAKLDWFRRGGEVSDRQWNDVLGVLKVQGPGLDQVYMNGWAERMGLMSLLRRAWQEAGLP